MKKFKSSGFTLIELLVVIAIIAILAGIVLVSLQSSRQKARDARRIGDVKQITTALDIYNNANSGFPPNAPDDTTSVPGVTIVGADPDNLPDGTPASAPDRFQDFLVAWPIAPIPFDNTSGSACDDTNNQYQYNQVSAGQDYTLSFCIGSPSGNFVEGLHTASSTGIN